ncbi:FAD-dependent monooxygenase [Nonomuraea longicatena]|uniref:FAD-dependent monooxygenase n=1 Tax=Nonomuraea longicatena TaxID=83682 RepID=A0ABN1Q5V1_9ACTN
MTNILISGAGIAGPALAHWLLRDGHAVTVVEKAASPREGGQAVDFKGAAQLELLDRMGILQELRRRRTDAVDLDIVDAAGRKLTEMPAEFTAGDLEVLRGDLVQVLYERTAGAAEYVFGDSITSLTETPDGVRAHFERGGPRLFDLVVGADGIHSNVRSLAFGPESGYVTHLGYYYALCDLPGMPFAAMYNEPGRMVSTGGTALFVFAAPELAYDRHVTEEMKEHVIAAYEGLAWHGRELAEAVRRSPDLYLDSLSRVKADRYSRGRVVLLGDAAYGNTLAGLGTGLALTGAYVLAGELRQAGGAHATAFARYEQVMRAGTAISKAANAGRFLAPRTALGIRVRNRVFKHRFLMKAMMGSVKNHPLKEYV